MAEIFTREKRSKVMSRIRSKNQHLIQAFIGAEITKDELEVASFLPAKNLKNFGQTFIQILTNVTFPKT